jgi:hypothetical protein
MRDPCTRRDFLSRASLAWLAATAGAGSGAAAPAREDDLADLRRVFGDPPEAAKPMTRWWWFGGAVTEAEITRELVFMKEAGLRGAEIQPVYPVAVDDPGRGIRSLRYFSEELFAALRHAVREARRLGLQLDFTLGSGWPYGGPFVPTGLAARRLRLLGRDAAGPGEVAWDLTAQLTGEDRLVAIVMAPLQGGELDLARSRVLEEQPKAELGRAARRSSVVRARLEEGPWRLMAFLDSPTGQQVKRPTLGMEGNVLDHHSREAMGLFLRAAGDRVMDALASEGGPPFHSVFCDSLEVYGADWTADFLAEFEKRRGYDLRPHLPALWQEAGPLTPHVRHDARLTLSELGLERFFAPLVSWAEGRGMKARIQAHGTPCDVMQAYGLAHIPEGETIFRGDGCEVNLRHRRLASSAAHLYGKPLASCETYTWLRSPLYMTTLEQMKAATDAVVLDGLNHVVNHGYSYSPPEAGEPGWAFYAATEANHTNTWWRHYPHLARYVQRACAVLQRGVAVNPVAVYLPIGDLFARSGAGGLHVDVEAEERLDPGLLGGLRRSGYDFDLVHDHALAALARVEGGELRAGTARYRVVLVPGARFLPPEAASRLAELARAGGHLIFVERLPEGAAGLRDREERSARTRRGLLGLFGGEPVVGQVAQAGKGTAAFVADSPAALERLRAVLGPDFEIVTPDERDSPARAAALDNVGFVHRRAGGIDYYFVANVSDRPQELRVRFAVGHRSPERWDPETGVVHAPLVHAFVTRGGEAATEVQLPVDPFESCFVVFGTAHDTAQTAPRVTAVRGLRGITLSSAGSRLELTGRVTSNGYYGFTPASGGERLFSMTGLPAPVRIEGPWTLSLGGADPLTLPALVSWTEIPEGRSFSGWGAYETDFVLGDLPDGIEWTLDLGSVHETAQVSLNGRDLGASWKAPRQLSCAGALCPGRNLLRVEVGSLWIHNLLARPRPDLRAVEETFGIRWGRYGEVPPEKVPPAGLLGPVRLLPARRVRLRP